MQLSKIVLLSAACVLVAIPLMGQTEYKTRPCTLATLNGNYGGHAEGVVFAGAPNAPAPAVGVGIHSFDGAGNFTLTFASTTGAADVTWPQQRGGTYTVTPDCHYSVVMSDLTNPSLPTFHIEGVIIGEGVNQEGHFIYTDPFMEMNGEIKKIIINSCSQRTLKGTYTVYGQGAVWQPDATGKLIAVPTAHVGFFTADGRGNFLGDHVLNVGGQRMEGDYTATYLLDSQCVQHVKLSTSFGPIEEIGVFAGSGQAQEFHGIITNKGWVIAETVKKQ